ncbi:MAG: hypothetical protein J2P28_17510, partial [Actinobacteria bacterium]|nr:hypothetical protein [Actinomycetota bacterium]
MPEYVSISYRGATYALGQTPEFYGIWNATALQTQPLERWPLTPEGWTAAWSRFTSLEVPGTITPVEPSAVGPVTGPVGPMTGPAGPVAGPGATMVGVPGGTFPISDPAAMTRNSRISAALTGVGFLLGIVGLFPAYVGGASLASQSENLVSHVIYLLTWAVSGALILAGGDSLRGGGIWLRGGALLGLGTSAVTLGFFVSDIGQIGQPLGGGGQVAAGAGLALSVLGWLGCTAGVALAAVSSNAFRSAFGAARGRGRGFSSQPGNDIVALVALIFAAIGVAVAFAPPWDRFTLTTAVGLSQTETAGNAFSNPALVLFGDVLVMIAIVAVIVVAALWRPLRLGAALAIGAAIPMVAQAISAVVQITQPATPEQFGISAADAARVGLRITSGLTAIFWVYCAFLGTLLLLCVWMLVAHGPAVGGALPFDARRSAPGGPAPGGPAPGGP